MDKTSLEVFKARLAGALSNPRLLRSSGRWFLPKAARLGLDDV